MLEVRDQLTVSLSCEHGSAPLGCIKYGEFLKVNESCGNLSI